MPDNPEGVDLVEVGPRDGFQSENRILPTSNKKEVIQGLLESGLREIQAASFVNPEKVPQLADAEELLAALPHSEGIAYTVLTLNAKGVERALGSPADRIEISLSLSDAHSRRNTGMSREQALREGQEMLAMCRRAGRAARISLQCAFGSEMDGPVPARLVREAVLRLAGTGAEEIVLADTSGLADPPAVEELVTILREAAPGVVPALHLHDTRGLGLANALRALQLGVKRFDTAVGGMGGCPFLPGAAGNIPTEDTAYLCSRLGRDSGIDLRRLVEVTRHLEALYGKVFPARIRSGTLPQE
ncbi:MAG: hydroxymethylglutaryl-CoA lyase [Desulfohalobiaceae bacterium]|nr:hydroxymethylglutaryl-CoA lyase [Desulfohalobiaceae bacterium]